MRRSLLIVATVLLAGAVAPAAGAQSTLTPAAYAAIDATYSAFVTIERHAPPSAVDYDAARSACRGLDSGDRLLRALRQRCSATLELRKRSDHFFACPSNDRCRRRALQARLQTSAVTDTGRKANAEIKRAGLTGGCAAALRTTKAQVAFVHHEHDYFRLIEQVIKGSSATIRGKLKRIVGAFIGQTDWDRSLSAVRRRKAFRAACSPPAG